MTIEKAEIKQATYKEVGVRVEEMLDQTERAGHEAAGARKALLAHLQNLIGIQAATDAELEKSIPDAATLKLIKEWLGKTIISTQQFSRHWGNVELQMAGEAAGHKATHDMLQKLITISEGQQETLKEAIAQGDVKVAEDGELEAVPGAHRPVGVRPMSMMQQRRAEETAASATPPAEAQEAKSRQGKGKGKEKGKK